MTPRAACTLTLLLLLTALPAHAEELPSQVRMSLDRYDRLMRSARTDGGPEATWSRAVASVSAPSDESSFVTVTLSATAEIVGDGTAAVPLLPADVVLEEALIDGSQATLLRRGGAYVAVIEQSRRRFSVSLTYLVPVRQAPEGGDTALVPFPPVPGATLTVDGRDGGAVQVWPSGEVTDNGGSISVALPSTVAAAIRWDGGAASRLVRSVAFAGRVNAMGDAVDMDADYEVWTAAPVSRVRLAPANLALVDVREGTTPLPTSIAGGWHEATVRGAGRHVLRAQFRLGVDRSQGQPTIGFALDRVPITRISLSVSGLRTVTTTPQVPVETTVSGEGEAAVTLATAHLPPSDTVTVQWTEARPSPEQQDRINVDTTQLVTIQEGVVRSRVYLRYEVLRGKMKELPIRIPDDVVLYKVSGDAVEDWRTFAATEEEPRQVRVMLGREQEGTYQLYLELETVVPKTEGAKIDVPVVRPLSAFRETGVVALLDSDKVGFAPAQQSLYTKVGEDALPVDIRQALTQKVAQAFKHIGEPGPIASGVAPAKAGDVRYDARVLTLYSVKEGSIVASAQVLVEIKSGRTDTVLLSLPNDVTVLGVTAPSLNKAEAAKGVDAGEGRKAHEVRFTQALEGAIQLDVELEVLLPKQLGKVHLPDVRVLGAEVEEGSFGVASETGVEVQPVASDDLRRVDVTELPGAVRLRTVQELLFGYQYAHTPWSLELEIKRHQTVETLKAVVNPAWLETTVLEDGHVVTRLVYQVANDDRQFLRLEMPEGAKVWTVSADGKPVKAVSDETGALAVPLPKGRAVPVEVTYEVRRDPLGLMGKVELVAPKADMLVTNLQWLVRAPRGIAIYSVDTDLAEKAGAMPPSIASEHRSDVALPIALPSVEDTQERMFTLPVHDPSEPAPKVTLSFAAAPGEGLEPLLGLLALVLLSFVAWRRAARRPMGMAGWAALVVGVLAAAVKAAAFGVNEGELSVLVAAVAGAALLAWLANRRKEQTA